MNQDITEDTFNSVFSTPDPIPESVVSLYDSGYRDHERNWGQLLLRHNNYTDGPNDCLLFCFCDAAITKLIVVSAMYTFFRWMVQEEVPDDVVALLCCFSDFWDSGGTLASDDSDLLRYFDQYEMRVLHWAMLELARSKLALQYGKSDAILEGVRMLEAQLRGLS